MLISRPKFLELTRRLALLTTVGMPIAACASTSSSTNTAVSPPTPTPTATATKIADQPDPTVGAGLCRCSWDTNANAAPRVCKKGEVNYQGVACIPGGGTSSEEGYYLPGGPLAPPDLSNC